MKREIYLDSVSLQDAEKVIDNILYKTNYKIESEEITVYDSLNRITFDSVFAKVSSPAHNASAMDGIATISALTFNASETNPITISKDNYLEVNTGNRVPLKFDSVIMIEDIVFNEDKTITIIRSNSLFENIRPIGEDIVKGDLIIPKNKTINSFDIAALLSGGITSLEVMKLPTIAIIPTGDEIVKSTPEIQLGEIIDSNSYLLQNELIKVGTLPTILNVVEDKYETLEKVIMEATNKYDLVLIGAGSSAGSRDYANKVVKNNGELLVHGISIKPGKPTIIGVVNETPIIGIPGFPVSTYIAYYLIVKRLVKLMLNQQLPSYQKVIARLAKKVYSSLKNKEYVRVKLGIVNNQLIATPLNRGAGVNMSLVKADGFLIIERLDEGFELHDEVEITLYNETIEVDNTLVSIGSHDIVLDLINDQMSNDKFNLASSHVGSFSGVLAIKNNESHISPVHILSDDGTYNQFLLEKYLDDDYHLIKGLTRKQCLYVKKGNPKNIKSIKDLTREDVTFVNRQKGSGTRILLDFVLKEKNVNPKDIRGYTFELPTHTSVAVSVESDRYDTGMGVVSVANMYGLDYIDISEESYDFLVHKSSMELPSFKKFIEVLKSNEFKNKVESIGGYVLKNPGEIII